MLSLPPPNQDLNCSYVPWTLLLRWKLLTWPGSCCSHLRSFSNASRLPEVNIPMTKGQGVRLYSGNIYGNEDFFTRVSYFHTTSLYWLLYCCVFCTSWQAGLKPIKTGYTVYEHELSNSQQTATFAWFLVEAASTNVIKCRFRKNSEEISWEVQGLWPQRNSTLGAPETQKAAKDFVVVLSSRLL